MKAFAKNRKSKDTDDNVDADTLDTDAVAEDAHDDFLERLGDLDRFIGTGTAPTPVARAGALVENRATRRLFDAHEHGVALAEAPEPEQSEADEFLERLGDLDRFVGGPVDAPKIAWSDAPVARNLPVIDDDEDDADTDWEPPADDGADDFIQRLGDLDRFIGGGDTAE